MSYLETSIRDWLQFRFGSLALEDSKRSIELTDLQFKESKRCELEARNVDLSRSVC